MLWPAPNLVQSAPNVQSFLKQHGHLNLNRMYSQFLLFLTRGGHVLVKSMEIASRKGVQHGSHGLARVKMFEFHNVTVRYFLLALV